MSPLFLIMLIISMIIIINIFRSYKTVPSNQVWIIERLGKYNESWAPGTHFLMPFIDKIARKVITTDQSLDIPQTSSISQDQVQLMIELGVVFQIIDARKFAYGVDDVHSTLKTVSISSLRNIIGQMTLEECIIKREYINQKMASVLDETVGKWGMKINDFKIKTMTPPPEILEALKRQKEREIRERARSTDEKAEKDLIDVPNDDKLIEMVTQDERIYEKLIEKILMNDKLSDKFIEKTAYNAFFVNKLKSKAEPGNYNTFF